MTLEVVRHWGSSLVPPVPNTDGSAHPVGVEGARQLCLQQAPLGILDCERAAATACCPPSLLPMSCPVLGLTALVSPDWTLSLETNQANGYPLGGLGKPMGIEALEGRSFAQRCPFIPRSFIRLIPEAGSGLGEGVS